MGEGTFAAAAAFGGTAIASAVATGLATSMLRRRAVLDMPNERSSHSVPTPRGGGIGLLAALVPALAILLFLAGYFGSNWIVLAAALLLAGVSWADDLRGLGVSTRLLAQATAVAMGLATLPAEATVFQDLLPFWADRLLAGAIWIGFINFFNFMDGSDGLAGVETMAIGSGLALAGLTFAPYAAVTPLAAALAGAGLGFLVWNWHPAKVFLGDVGSIPLGFIAGWLLILLALTGAWATALILPLYFLADGLSTLVIRLARGAKVWEAHREHAYQKAVARGVSHSRVALRIAYANCGLVALALAALDRPLASLALAVLLAGLLTLSLRGAPAPPAA